MCYCNPNIRTPNCGSIACTEAARKSKIEWIDVNDRLPEHLAIDVLICTSSGLVTSTFYCVDKNYFNLSCGEKLVGETDEVSAHFRHAREYGYRVTHWMPLPLPPSKKQEY